MLHLAPTYESIQNLLDEIEEEYANIEDEEIYEDNSLRYGEIDEIIDARTENLDELKTALRVVMREMESWEMREKEIQEEKRSME